MAPVRRWHLLQRMWPEAQARRRRLRAQQQVQVGTPGHAFLVWLCWVASVIILDPVTSLVKVTPD